MNARCIEDHRGTRLCKPGRSQYEIRRIDLAVAMVHGLGPGDPLRQPADQEARVVSWQA